MHTQTDLLHKFWMNWNVWCTDFKYARNDSNDIQIEWNLFWNLYLWVYFLIKFLNFMCNASIFLKPQFSKDSACWLFRTMMTKWHFLDTKCYQNVMKLWYNELDSTRNILGHLTKVLEIILNLGDMILSETDAKTHTRKKKRMYLSVEGCSGFSKSFKSSLNIWLTH